MANSSDKPQSQPTPSDTGLPRSATRHTKAPPPFSNENPGGIARDLQRMRSYMTAIHDLVASHEGSDRWVRSEVLELAKTALRSSAAATSGASRLTP